MQNRIQDEECDNGSVVELLRILEDIFLKCSLLILGILITGE